MFKINLTTLSKHFILNFKHQNVSVMTTLTIRIPDEETKKVSSFIEDLGGEIVALTFTKEELRQQTLKELEEGLNEAFDIIEGKAERKSLMQGLRG